MLFNMVIFGYSGINCYLPIFDTFEGKRDCLTSWLLDSLAVRAASFVRMRGQVDERDEKLDDVKMQAWRACGTRLTHPRINELNCIDFAHCPC